MASAENSGTATNVCSDCHIGTLASEHATTGPSASPIKVGCTTGGYAGNTAGCHNTTTGTIAPGSATAVKNNWNSGSKLCSDCHTAKHNAIATSHTGTSTQSCGASGAGCHNTYDLAALHRNRAGGGGCRLSGCHDPATKSVRPSSSNKSCGSGNACHTAYTGTAGHRANTITGNETTHTATAMTTKVDGTTYDTGGNNTCAACHSATLLTAHSTSANANTCGGAGSTGCHNDTTPNSVLVIKTNSWSTKTCDECHVTNLNGGTAKHNTYTLAAHTATASGCTLSAGCHGWASGGQTLDVRAVHNRAFTNAGTTPGCTATGSDSKGTNPGCHALNKAMSGALTCGDTGTCHAAHTGSNHGAPNHDINTLITNAQKNGTAAVTYHGTSYTGGNSWGCGGCHYSDLIKEHGAGTGTGGHTMEGGGSGCGICHSNKGGTVGTHADDTAVINAITDGVPTTGDMRCVSCHTSSTGDTASAIGQPHKGTASTTGSSVKSSGNPLAEWANVDAYKGSGHNMGGSNLYKASPDGNGATAGGTVAWGGIGLTGTNPRTGATWTTTDQLLCSDCHRFGTQASDAAYEQTGPQGAAAVVWFRTGATTYSQTRAWSTGAAPYNVQGNGAVGLCGVCHTAVAVAAHQNSAHTVCIRCHTAIPHTSNSPRLTINQAATAPYKSASLTGAGLNVGTTAAPLKTNCVSTSCGAHSATAPYW